MLLTKPYFDLDLDKMGKNSLNQNSYPACCILRLNYKVTLANLGKIIIIIIGALGTVKKGMVENIKKVSERATMTEIQKICMLGSARILRKVLSV